MKKTRILVVEDEIIIAMEIADRLKAMDYEVIRIVGSGESAINFAFQDKPDLILMDIMLQGDMDGIEAATKIHSFSDTPVIYLTANADESTLQRAKVTDAFGYLIKPFEEKELNTTIEMALYKHKMEAILKASEAQFRGIFENSSIGIFRMDFQGNILLANPKLIQILDCKTIEDVYDKNFSDFMVGGLDDFRKLFEKLQHDGSIKNYQIKIFKIDGTTIHANFNGGFVKDKDGIRRLDGTIEDVSIQYKYQKELIKAKEKAEESDRLKTEFLAGMSHEIRTPINTIMSYLSLLNGDLNNETNTEYKEIFDAIEIGSLRLTRTIDSILNMAQFQSGTFDVFKEKINIVDEILNNLFEEFKNTAKQRGLELKFSKSAKNNNILGDKYSLSQLFVNLIDNGLKYTAEGTVEVNVYNDEEGLLCVDIKDTGIGIAKDFLPNLFIAFSQEEQGYTRKFDGNGLGLALAKRYCELNDAVIKVISEKGKGSTFTVKFTRTSNNFLNPIKNENFNLSN